MTEQVAHPILVADSQSLRDCVNALESCDALAVDTEFMRTDTFYPILGLIQIYDGSHCWLIDPLGVENLQPLAEVFTNEAITKVFHSCSEDLEVLQHVMGSLPLPLFDTQIAAALAGYGFSRGYAALVSDMLDIHVPKGETRSDWLQRPLTEAQLGYAASDVYHLLPVYHQLLADLDRLDRTNWVAEEMQDLVTRASNRDDGSDYYRKVKGAWRLSPEELLILQQLCYWREKEARSRNRPRNRVVPDRTLLEVASRKPQNKAVLAEIEGMHPGIIRRYGELLLGMVKTAEGCKPDEHLQPLDSPLPKEARDLGKAMKAVVSDRAESYQLPVEMLARKRDIEELVRSHCDVTPTELPTSLASGWRYHVVGEDLLKAISAQPAC
ncbi:MAG: ribonuclease D [Gammaproteobacteria bacterium]|nr:MAG: ribonuclease D [Gammaproteobacteria bacterium]